MMAGYARSRVDKACTCMSLSASHPAAWDEYERAGEVLAYAMRCGIVGTSEGLRMLERLDAALEAGILRQRRKKVPLKGKAAGNGKIAA